MQLRFDVRHSPSLTHEVLARLERLAGKRLTRDGVLVITAHRHRTQERNRDDALERLVELIRAATLTGGRFYTPESTAKLLEELPRPEKVPLDTDPPIPLWNTWTVLCLFLAVITAEWVLRKRKQLV